MHSEKITAQVQWKKIDTVLLDMDGTLLDKHFDDYFWEQYVPEVFSLNNNMTLEKARETLLHRYKREEGTLAWTDLDFWSEELGMDIPALKLRVDNLIQVHPYVVDFLKFCKKMNKHLCLVTNAHSKTLDIKLNKTALGGYFDRIICSQEVGMAKEDPVFWEKLEKMLGFNRLTTMLADDTEEVLASAKKYGIQWLIYVARPSSRKPVKYSQIFPSIEYFKELITSDEIKH
ncbi:MAG: HAD-IA family hydrolase [Proteobacteria bacterium]|nr:HAD-IA family hydrolase [Pseudomonadota bacterium]MBU1708579.1 HAD-IA family hydrolase [Pseudomonadota bacterium]